MWHATKELFWVLYTFNIFINYLTEQMNKMLIKSEDDTLDGILISNLQTIFTTYKNELKFNRLKYKRDKSEILHLGKTNQCTSIRGGTSGMVTALVKKVFKNKLVANLE